jgi:hypothetical protein
MLGHAGHAKQPGTIGSMIDNLVAVRPDLSMLIGSAGIKRHAGRSSTAAADNLSLYMLARAGYNLDQAAVAVLEAPGQGLSGHGAERLCANHPATGATHDGDRQEAAGRSQGQACVQETAGAP